MRVDDAKGALIEPFTCGFYAVLRNGAPNASETVVVSGGGTIGLVTAAAAIGMGARVIVVDPVPLASRHREDGWAPTRPSTRRPAIRARRCKS